MTTLFMILAALFALLIVLPAVAAALYSVAWTAARLISAR